LRFNPVKHGLVTRVHRDVERGIFPLDWAGDVAVTGEFGEAS
jgi:putative transposase